MTSSECWGAYASTANKFAQVCCAVVSPLICFLYWFFPLIALIAILIQHRSGSSSSIPTICGIEWRYSTRLFAFPALLASTCTQFPCISLKPLSFESQESDLKICAKLVSEQNEGGARGYSQIIVSLYTKFATSTPFFSTPFWTIRPAHMHEQTSSASDDLCS